MSWPELRWPVPDERQLDDNPQGRAGMYDRHVGDVALLATLGFLSAAVAGAL
jgi:hypothetical protein